jgi:hypothetical protein
LKVEPANIDGVHYLIYKSPEQYEKAFVFDVAVYGSGPAGISLAMSLAKSGVRVGLFEAGGDTPPDLDDDHPYNAENLGRRYDLLSSRLRYFGGTSNHWGGWCRPLDNYDFAERDYIPATGWPITRSELVPYYSQALRICEVDTADLGLDAFDHDFGYEAFLHRKSDLMTVKNFLFSPPTRFGERYGEAIEDMDGLDCVLNSTVYKFRASSDEIDSAIIKNKAGQQFDVAAKFHVMAMGAVENARTLLFSEIANSSDYVGRCFSDHLGLTVAKASISRENKYYFYNDERTSTDVMPHLGLKDEVCREHELVNFGIILEPRKPGNQLEREVLKQTSGWQDSENDLVSVLVRMENIPNPESRLTLTTALDPYGVPRSALNWKPMMADYHALERLAGILRMEFGLSGARFRTRFKDATAMNSVGGTYQNHHLGTTRMSLDPENGVVNSDLRSHDIRNLFIAGSSVFPVFGFANPTLTIVALSLRLAEHLKSKVER